MNRSRNNFRRSVRAAPCLVLVAILAASASDGATGGDRHLALAVPSAWPVSYTDQGPPPPGAPTPAMVAKFLRLVGAFEASDADAEMSFGQWIVLCGVTDVREFWCLMWLWWAWQNQAAA